MGRSDKTLRSNVDDGATRRSVSTGTCKGGGLIIEFDGTRLFTKRAIDDNTNIPSTGRPLTQILKNHCISVAFQTSVQKA
ncbi:hypothetical protein PCANC_20043 [Puccinia coronata f. sp. avenae]|uniref:Uncharacterized protein n=1 Tax=Puccinia coronata f. sp. avenae TaxID=200324 RepID=A0A2N5T192_9BASI|nr:hypothetical protein PCANC_20043 [Puccinia coronata f. sp. avenae]